MKAAIWLALFLLAYHVEAKLLEVPEQCFSRKVTPCLTQIQDAEETLTLKQGTFRALNGAILQWKSFEDVSVDILKGKMQVSQSGEGIRINEVYLAQSNQLVERDSKQLFILDLNRFILSTYTVFDIQTNNVLAKSTFLEKSELLLFVARFFERRNQFLSFLKSIERPWKKEFITQTKTKTKVLQRSVASVEQSERLERQEKEKQSLELKRVREQFFFMTFYR